MGRSAKWVLDGEWFTVAGAGSIEVLIAVFDEYREHANSDDQRPTANN